MMSRNAIIYSFLAFALLMSASAAQATDFDGSRALLMAVIDITECHPGGVCEGVTPQEASLPRFIEIDFDKKAISEVGDDQDERRTAIQSITKGEGVLILQGAQNGRGWSLTITEASGDAVATISDTQSGFVIFGACTPR
jgi:hypothetical protein